MTCIQCYVQCDGRVGTSRCIWPPASACIQRRNIAHNVSSVCDVKTAKHKTQFEMQTAKENLIYLSRHLRAVGQRWVCPADSLPLFFYNAVDEGWNTRNSTSPAESPMRGNNWRPTHSGGGERPTFFLLPSQNFIRRTKLPSRFYSAYTVLCAV